MAADNLGFIKFAGAQTANGNSTDIAIPAFAENISLLVNVTAVSGTTPSMALTVQWSGDDGATWFNSDPADAFTAITATGGVVKTFPVRGTSVRLAWAITGTTPSFNFTARAVAVGARQFV